MTKASIHFITGGQRSGKSLYGEQLALEIDSTPTYLATSKHWDKEHSQRIALHQQRRNTQWHTIEEQMHISTIQPKNKVIFLDCITLWLTNIMDHYQYDPEKSFQFAQEEWTKLMETSSTIIAISNEIGMGVIPMEKVSRVFVDLQGKMNQFIAQHADQVTFMVSGLPLKVK